MKNWLQKIGMVALAVCMSGCFKFRIQMDVSKDATVTGSYTVLMSEALLTMGGTEVDDELQTMTDLAKEESPEVEIESVKEGEGDDAYAGIKLYTLPDNSYTITKENNVITLEIPVTSLQSTLEENADTASYGISLADLKEYGAEATITINMPAKAESNAGTVDGKTVTIDLLEITGVDKVTITCNTGLSAGAIAGIVGGVVAVAACLFFVLKKKKA